MHRTLEKGGMWRGGLGEGDTLLQGPYVEESIHPFLTHFVLNILCEAVLQDLINFQGTKLLGFYVYTI